MSKIISVSATSWTNLHSAAGIAAGAPVTVQNQGVYAVRLEQGTDAPAKDHTGLILDTLPGSQSFANVTGPGSLWAKATAGTSGTNVHIQEVV